MPQAIAETLFDLFYLGFDLIVGLTMLFRGRSALVRRAGLMTFLLGAGDAFHLIPRAWALWTTGLAAHAAALGFGKFVTSITMTVFYLMLYYIWRERYQVRGRRGLTRTLWALAALRVALCLFPQNDWLSATPSLRFGILRNLPFAAIGLILIVLFAQTARRDPVFRYMPRAIALSFAFYLPVVLFSGVLPVIGMLMIPKTCAYVWIVCMCRKLYLQET